MLSHPEGRDPQRAVDNTALVCSGLPWVCPGEPPWHLFVHIWSLESLENHIWPVCTSVELNIVKYYSLCLDLGPFLTLEAVML